MYTGDLTWPFDFTSNNILSEIVNDLVNGDLSDRMIKERLDILKHRQTFHRAVKLKELRQIKDLLSSGVSIQELDGEDQTCIHFAVENNFLQAVDVLFPRYDCRANRSNKNGLTHFHIACMTGHIRVVERFVLNGVNVNLPCPSNGLTPLHFAVKSANSDVVEFLLKREAQVDIADSQGRTALHLACGIVESVGESLQPHRGETGVEAVDLNNGTLKIVQLLVEHESNVNIKDAKSDTAMFHIFRDDINCRNYIERRLARESQSSLFDAYRRMKRSILNRLRSAQMRKLEFLLERGVDLSVRNDDGDTLLHCAIKDLKTSRQFDDLGEPYFDDSVHVEMVKLILSSGADIEAKNNNGETALQIAVSVLSADIVNVLLKNNADIDSVKFNFDCFCYPSVLPCLEAVFNLLVIVDALTDKGWPFSLKDGLTVLKFFIRNNVDCQYADVDPDFRRYKVNNLLEYGTDDNIINTLDSILRGNQSVRATVSDSINHYIQKLRIYLLDININVIECLVRNVVVKDNPVWGWHLQAYQMEAMWFIPKTLADGRSLIGILRYNNSWVKDDCKEIIRLCTSLTFFGNIIKGYFAKGLVRKFAVKVTSNYMRVLLNNGLPDSCCEMIADYLSNEDLWKFCLATIVED